MKKKTLLLRFAVLVAAMMCALGAAAAEAYANYTPSNTTLTFYYDNLRSSRTGTTYDLVGGIPGWESDNTIYSVTKVVFNSSFSSARPTSTEDWFYGMNNLESIVGLQYLNTSEVTTMLWMFGKCSKLTSLDLSHFNTAKVTDMGSMFQKCTGLESVNVSSFNTSKVTDMSYMFHGCGKLTTLDVSSFNTSKVTTMEQMFINCSSLKTIFAGSAWSTAAVMGSSNMFALCEQLVGGKGTTYDSYHVDASYAHIDGGPSNPGYFTDKNAGQRGDVNGDNSVNIADVTTLINYLLSHNATGLNLQNANCNLDSTINIADVTALINYLLSHSW